MITFDNRGVAASSGRTPNTIAQMALDAIDFIDSLGVGSVDLLGFSIGSFLAQEIALIRPSSVRRVVLASSAPRGASEMHGWAPDVIGAVGKPETSAEEYLSVFSRSRRRATQQEKSSSDGSTGRGRSTATRTPPGRPAWRNTTRCAPGVSRIIPSSSGSRQSTGRYLWPTETAIP